MEGLITLFCQGCGARYYWDTRAKCSYLYNMREGRTKTHFALHRRGHPRFVFGLWVWCGACGIRGLESVNQQRDLSDHNIILSFGYH